MKWQAVNHNMGTYSKLPAISKKENKDEPKVAQITAQKSEQVSKPLSKVKPEQINIKLINLPTKKEIKQLSFDTSEEKKVKVNTEIPEQLNDQLEKIRFELKVGKYELVEYIITQFLENIK